MQATGELPSQRLDLDAWTRSKFQQDGWWTCYQFDQIVLQFGTLIENKLAETISDKDFRKRYKIADLLYPANKRPKTLEEKRAAMRGYAASSGGSVQFDG